MHQYSKHILAIRRNLYIIISALYIVYIFFSPAILEHFLAWLVAAGLFFSLWRSGKGLGRVALLLLLLGSAVLIKTGAPWTVWSAGLRQMLGILMLVFFVQLLEYPIELGGYSPAVYRFFFSRARSLAQIFTASSFLAYLFGLIALVATIPITFYTLVRSIQRVTSYPERFLSLALVRGRSMALLATPISPIVALALSFTDLRWVEFFPYGFLLSIVGLVVSSVLFYFSPLHGSLPSKIFRIEEDRNLSKVIHFIVAIVALIGSLLVLDHLWEKSIIDILIVIILVFSAAWAVSIRRLGDYGRAVRQFFLEKIPHMETQYSLFISAGFFTVALQHQGTWLSEGVNILIETLGEVAFLFLIPLLLWGLSMLGINPVVGIVLVGESLIAGGNPFPELLFAIALVAGASTAFLLSPFTATNMITAGLVDRSPFQVGLSWNWFYALIMLGVTYAFIAIIMVV